MVKNLAGDHTREHTNHTNKMKKMQDDLKTLEGKLKNHGVKQAEEKEEDEKRHLEELANIEEGYEVLKQMQATGSRS